MRLDFKKGLSFVLALVMMVSTLTAVNVVSVSAQDLNYGTYEASGSTAKWDFSATGYTGNGEQIPSTDTVHGITLDSSKKINIYKNCLGITKGATIMVPVPKNSNGSISIIGTDNNATKYLMLGSNKITLSKTGSNAGFTSSDSSTGFLTLTCPSASGGEFKIQTMTITLTDGTFSTGSYTRNLVKDNLQSLVSDGFKLDSLRVAKSPTDTVYNTLIYDDPGYSIVRSQVTLKEGLQDDNGVTVVTKEGDAFTVTPTPAMFMKNVSFDAKNIRVKNAAKKILHLTCKHGTVYSLKLSDTADEESYYPVEGIIKGHNENGGYEVDKENLVLPAHADEFTVTMGGGTLNDGVNPAGASKFTLKDASSEYKADFTPYTLEPINSNISETKFTDLLTSSDSRGERILGGTVIDEGHHFFVLGADYNNTYKLSGLANTEDFGTGTQAIVIRSHNVDEETGNEEGGIGFTLEEETGYTYTVAINCVAVRDRESTGLENTSIGIGEYNKETYAFTDTDTIPEQTITKTIDPFNNPETDDYKTSEIKRFTGLKPGKTYGIYNPGAKDEQGNIRIYSISVTKVPDTLEPVPDPSDKYVAEGTHKFGSSIDLFKQAFNSKQDYTFEYDNFTFHGSTTLDQESDNVKFRKGDTIKFKVKNVATLSMVLASGSKDVTVSGDNDTVTFTSSNYSTQTMKLKPDVQYTIDAVSESSNSKIVSITITPDGPSIPTITGTVTLSKKYKYEAYAGVTSVKGNSDADGSKINVHFLPEDDSTTTEKTINETPSDTELVVKAQKVGGEEVKDITVKDGSFTIGNAETGLEAGEYNVTITAGGATKTDTITVGDSPVTGKSYTLEAPTYRVRFITNMKNFADNDKAYPIIKTKGGTELFNLQDITYYNFGDTGVEAVNGSASTTHIVYMPKGDYEYSYSSNFYTMQQSATGTSSDMSFSVDGSGIKRLYFIPKYTENGNIAEAVTSKVSEAKNALESSADEKKYVSEGTYTFDVPAGAEVQEVTVKFNGSSEGANGMKAYGIKGTKDGDYFGINKSNGAVVFSLDRPMLAHITTEQKACVLYSVDGQSKAINGAYSAIPTDSTYFTRTVSLDAGTYAIVSMANDSEGETPAKVTEIQFIGGSPFKILAEEDRIKPYDGADNAKMIIGKYNTDNDNLIGTSTIESYSVFAILVSANRDALSVANIDNIANAAGYVKNGTAESEKSDSDGEYEPQVFEMTVGDSKKVIRDETDTVYSRVVGENGEAVVENTQEEGGDKYYATIVKNLTPGTTYYAVGAAKLAGSAEGATNKDTWLIQSEPAVEFTVD